MQLETITANIRSRNAWEAIDLGFAMVRAWWLSIYTPLVILLVAIIAALFLLLPNDYYGLILLILWWLKPLYHRLILYVISHQVFGNSPSWADTLKALPELLFRTGLLGELTWRRFSFSRGFRLPVRQLERLTGSEHRARQQLLIEKVHAPVIWLNIAIFHFQIIFFFSFLMLLWLFVPGYYADELFYELVSNRLPTLASAIEIIVMLGFVAVITLLEPYYIAANFALYLNRRTQLEAWDIELDFRKMASRLSGLKNQINALVACIIVSLFSSSLLNQSAKAEDNRAENTPSYTEHLSDTRLGASESSRVIQEVMQNEHLHREKTTKRWRLKKTDETDTTETPADVPEWIQWLAKRVASVIEYALWLIIALAIVLLYVYRRYWLPIFINLPDKQDDTLQPDILFGMDVRKESLPDDVIAAARALWHEGKTRDALSLLYRCALTRLINHDQLPLEHSHTEGDILKLSQPVLAAQSYNYLQKLTHSWMQVAYAHDAPMEADMSYLLDRWHDDFAHETPETHK
ncbi:MAG: hypothetical protein CSB47_10265 [Proteobacteria bacterium]|nr:MAG: hypothetical protein CSB47_10265 [Pseudomonadota bacterium]